MDFDPLNPPADPYVALGVSRTDDLAAVKSAYKKLALKHHPDKCKDESKRDEHVSQFVKIQQAYEILSDEDKKRGYDDLRRLLDLKDKLRNQKPGGSSYPKGPVRSHTYYPEPAAPKYDDRKPKYYEEADILRGTTRKAEFEPRSKPSRPERRPDRADKETEERRKKEKLRDSDIRNQRSSKYDNDERYPPSRQRSFDDRDGPRRKADDSTSKYDTWAREAHRHQSSLYDDEPRPGVRRGSSGFAQVRRSQASPRSREEQTPLRNREKDQMRLAELRRQEDLLREKKQREADRDRTSRRSERPRFSEEYVLPRRETEPLETRTSTSPTSPPLYSRSESMPTGVSSPENPPNAGRTRTSPRRTTNLRQETPADSDYSSSDNSAKRPSRPARPVKATSYAYTTFEPRLPMPPRSKSRSRSRERAPKMSSSRRGSDDPRAGIYPASQQSIPLRPRSRERVDRDRDSRREEPYTATRNYATYGPSDHVRTVPFGDIKFAKAPTKDDIRFGPVPRLNRRSGGEDSRDPFTPSFGRSKTMPVY